MAVVTEHLVSLIAKQVDDHALVVWYDPEGHYRDVASDLALAQTTVARYEDSFFALRQQIDHHLNNLHPPRLIVYVPMAQALCQNALVELEVAGVVMQPGQQPPTRNTRLSVVARNAVKPFWGEESANALEKQVESGRMSLTDLNELASKIQGTAKQGLLSLIFKTVNPPEIAQAFLASDKYDADIAKKSAAAELALVLETTFDAVLPSDDPLPMLREKFAWHILATDLIVSLQGAVPAALSSLKIAGKTAAQEACAALARNWRLRTDVRESYVAAANKVEPDLHLSKLSFSREQIVGTETFLGVEAALLRSVEAALLDQPSEALLALAEAGKSRFWSEVMPSIQAHWTLIAVAAQVLLEADWVAQALKKAPASALAVVKAYTEGNNPWCMLDTYHRRMEKRWYDFEADDKQHKSLEQLVRKAESRYMEVGSALAKLFMERYEGTKLPLKDIIRQTEVFEKKVKPRLGAGKTAYVWVDAMRFEMARELYQILAVDFDLTLQPGIATVPTITEIGMASLLPHSQPKPKVISVGGGKLALEINGIKIKDRQDRIKFLGATTGVKVFDAKLDDLLPKPSKKVREGIAEADLILLTSKEVDTLGEDDNLLQARLYMDEILNHLRRSFRILVDLGVKNFILAADHGHLFGEEIGEEMKMDPPGGDTADLHKRVWIGKGGTSDPSYLRTSLATLGVDSDMDLATPWRFACFKARGARAYFHGGMSPQELLIPVVTMTPKAQVTVGGGSMDWKLIPGSKKISTRFFSVQIAGTSTGLFESEPPKVRIEIRAKGKSISKPVSASYGFEDATGDVQLKASEENAKEILANTVTLMIDDVPNQKTVSVVLLDATTGAELIALKDVEASISL